MAVLQPHDRLGGYSIIRFVRTGSTGQLYIARRVGAPGFAPNVAIKVVAPPLFATEATSDFFDEEIIRASKIDDPHVVRLDELGDDHGVRYVAMELVRGFSLSDMLAFYYERERRIRPGLAVYIAMQGALGMQAAHETRDPHGTHLRLVHGSLSTKRVLISWKGHVKLIRFGFANVMADEPLTSWQRLFRAPDLEGQDRLDGRADVFALGAILLASLARGGLPVLDGMVDLGAIHGALARAEGIPAAVGDVLVHSLQTRREDRPTPLAFYRALVDAMPEALKITPSDVARELAAIRLDREFATFAQDRSLVGSSYIPPRMTEVPSPFTTTRPRSSDEASAASERLVVPKMPAPPLLASMGERGERTERAERNTPVIIEQTPAPPTSSADHLTAARIEYPAAAQEAAALMTTVESQPAREARKASERPSAKGDGDPPSKPGGGSGNGPSGGDPPGDGPGARQGVERTTVAEEPPAVAIVAIPTEPGSAASSIPVEEPAAPAPPRSKLPLGILAVAFAFAAGLLVAHSVNKWRSEKAALTPANTASGHAGAAFDYSPPMAPVPLSTFVRTTKGEGKPAVGPGDAGPKRKPDAGAVAEATSAQIGDPGATVASANAAPAPAPAPALTSDEAFDEARKRVLAGDVAAARLPLEARLSAGKLSRDELVLLRSICKQQRDAACLERLRRVEAATPSSDAKSLP